MENDMRALAITIGLVLLPGYAAAQFGNPAGMAPDTKMEAPGKPAANQTNYQDRLFAQLVTGGGLAEVDVGKLAAGRAGHDSVKAFANRMVDDHGDANGKLKDAAEKSRIPLPDGPDPDHKKLRADLEKLDGTAFDRAYMQAQIVDHQKTVQLLIWEIGSGEDADIQGFAKRTLPTVLEHLQMARDIQVQLAAEAQPAAAK